MLTRIFDAFFCGFCSGKHGVVIAQNGPGISNFVTGVAAAYWAHSPVVAITPEAGSMTKGLSLSVAVFLAYLSLHLIFLSLSVVSASVLLLSVSASVFLF